VRVTLATSANFVAVGASPILSLIGVSKSFPGVRALHDIAFSLRAGEVTALIGENGAGKSTIVKILTGIYAPDQGEIVVGGAVRHFASPRDSWAAGIAAIHQETVMFDELTVAENIFMGHMPGGRFINWGEMRSFWSASKPTSTRRRRSSNSPSLKNTWWRSPAP
jgi:rhamnose transport system ATP-binding protein